MHKGKTCLKAEEEIYRGWANKIGAHRCPKCKVPIEKNDGCMHMKCT